MLFKSEVVAFVTAADLEAIVRGVDALAQHLDPFRRIDALKETGLWDLYDQARAYLRLQRNSE